MRATSRPWMLAFAVGAAACSAFGSGEADDDEGPPSPGSGGGRSDVDGGLVDASGEGGETPVRDAALAFDDFARLDSTELGAAPLGGVWLVQPARGFRVAAGAAASLAGAPLDVYAFLPVAARDVEVAATFEVTEASAQRPGFLRLIARKTDTAYYACTLRVGEQLDLQLTTTREDRLRPATTPLAAYAAVPGPPTRRVRLRFQVTGALPTRVKCRAWAEDGAEPTRWTEAEDASPAAMAAGDVGVAMYATTPDGGAPRTFSFDDFAAQAL